MSLSGFLMAGSSVDKGHLVISVFSSLITSRVERFSFGSLAHLCIFFDEMSTQGMFAALLSCKSSYVLDTRFSFSSFSLYF